MLSFKLGEEKVSMIQSWADVPIKRFIEAYPMMSDIPTEVQGFLYEGKDLSINGKMKLMWFKKKFLSFWLKIGVGKLDKVRMGNVIADGVITEYGLDAVFEAMRFLLYLPVDFKIMDSIKHEGETYHKLNDEGAGIVKKMCADATFEEQIEILQLGIIAEHINKNPFSSIPAILATLYKKKGESFSEDLQKKRTEKFSELYMNEGWSAFFLLDRLTNSTKNFMHLFLKNQVERDRRINTPAFSV